MSARAARDRLAILVHEVRSPVAALAALSETLADASLERPARRELAGLAVAACRAIERLVSDAAVTSVRREEVDAGRLVRETVASAALSGALVRAVVPAKLPRLEADPLRLRQALDNLVSNALAHSDPGEEVVVSAREHDGELLLSVADSGSGIPPADQGRIFEAGVRLDASRPGSGLGLPLARAIAEAHEGELTVESVPGEGAVFTIALPLRSRER